MGREKVLSEWVFTAVRLPPDDYRWLSRYARSTFRTRSDVLRMLIAEARKKDEKGGEDAPLPRDEPHHT